MNGMKLSGKRQSCFSKCLLYSIFLLAILFLFTPSVWAADTYEVGSLYQFQSRIGSFADGDTIKLTADITDSQNYAGNFDGKSITIDLNGHSLNMGMIVVDNCGSISVVNSNFIDGNKMTVGVHLTANGGSTIASAGDGVLYVSNGAVTASGSGSKIAVDKVTTNSYGVKAENGGEVTVNEDVIINTANSAVFGVNTAGTTGGTVTINGDISVTGSMCYGLKIEGTGSIVTVNGNITAEGSSANGVFVAGDSDSVTVTGNVTGVSTGAKINQGNSNRVSVTGDVSASGDYGQGVSIVGSGTRHQLIVTGKVTVSGNNAYGALIYAADSTIAVTGDIVTTGDISRGAEANNSGGLIEVEEILSLI